MLAEHTQLPREGGKVGPYLIIRTLSTSLLGNFAIATHKASKEDQLIHLIPEALLRADALFETRYREALEKQQVLPKGAHLPAVDVTLLGGNLVVSYGPGVYRSLNDIVLQADQPLAEDKVRRYLKSIASSLAEAEKIEQGHFFLSPDFLFLNEAGEVRMAGIGLFQSMRFESFERLVSASISPIASSRSRTFSYTEILSPEIRDSKKRDPRSDFYCLGLCAYFMATGRKPDAKWVLPSEVRQDMVPGWDLFISHCLEPNPADRFPHYRAFLRDLDHIEELTEKPDRSTGPGLRLRRLKQVPLPAGLQKHVPGRRQLFRQLGLLGLIGLLAVIVAFYLLNILFSGDPADPPPEAMERLPSGEGANLIVRVDPPNARVVVSGPETGRFNLDEEALFLQGRPGAYTLEVSAPLRGTQRLAVELAADRVEQRAVTLGYGFASLRVEGAVGTDLYVETRPGFSLYLGTIPENRNELIIEQRLLQGEHSLIALHPYFHDVREEGLVLGELATTLSLEQVPRPTRLVVTSDPPGASVHFGDSLMGRTPIELEGLPFGSDLDIRLEKEGYRPLARQIRLAQGERRVLENLALEALLGGLRLSFRFEGSLQASFEELRLEVDGTAQPADPSVVIELAEGPHSLRLTHPDFHPEDRSFEVKDGEVLDLELVLRPLPARLRPVLDLEAPPRFRIEGNEVDLTEEGLLLIPSAQAVTVEAIIPNHHNVIQSFSASPAQLIEWPIPLKPLPGPATGEAWSPPYFDFEMVWVEPQLYNLGSPVDEFRRLPNEDNRTAVRISRGYWIGRHEVTQDLFLRIMGENPSRFKGSSLPVDSVSWHLARDFCARLSDFERNGGRLPEGYVYRLPTEAEWELAARAGTRSAFSFGDVADPTSGNFQGFYRPGETVGQAAEARYGTLPVGSFAPNPWGLYDVHGNVAEWVSDRFWDRHPGGSLTDPYNNSRGRGYVLRGGSWQDSADRVRSAAREGLPGDSRRNSLGFRFVLGPVLPPAP